MRQTQIRQKTRFFLSPQKVLNFNEKPKEAWERIWSRGQGTRPLRTTGFNEFDGRPKILSLSLKSTR